MSAESNLGDIPVVPVLCNVRNAREFPRFSAKAKVTSLLIINKLTEYFVLLSNFLLSEYTKDVVWTGIQIFVALIVLATLSLATIFITIIINVNEAMKHKNAPKTASIEDDNALVVGDCKDVDKSVFFLKRPGSQNL